MEGRKRENLTILDHTNFTVISGDDALERLRVAFTKETALYMGGFRLPPMMDDLAVGINEELLPIVSLPFPAT